jgi:hypothetical protein
MSGVSEIAAIEVAMHAMTSRCVRTRRSIGAAASVPRTPKSSARPTRRPIIVPLRPMSPRYTT